MMKRITFILLALILLSGCAASREHEIESSRVTFYFAASDTENLAEDAVIQSETRNFQVFTLKQLLDLYFHGPLSENLQSPFPAGTSVISMNEEEDGLELTMSGEFFTLQGIDLTIASCCLVNTVCDYINAEHITLVDEMERIRMELSPNDFLLNNIISQTTDTAYTVYFADPNFRYLIAETREVTLSENESPETYLLRQLLAGPVSDSLQEVIPEGTLLLDVSCENNVCTVNFSREFVDNRTINNYCAYTTIFSIVNTLTNLDSVLSVSFLVEGEPIESYGIFPLSEPVLRDAGAIGPVKANGTEIDTNVYVVREDMAVSFAVPIRVKLSISQPMAEAVARAVISHESSNGFFNPIPYGTEILSVSVSGSTCYIDLSRDFVPSDNTRQSEENAVWALVTSLTDLDNITSVALTIEGESGGLNYVDISEPLTRELVQFH